MTEKVAADVMRRRELKSLAEKQKRRNWQVRLLEEVKERTDGIFVTLTFSNERFKKYARRHKKLKGYDLDNAIATEAVKHFLENWRKEHKTSVRHWLVTELGHNGTENIHLHGIIWTENTPKNGQAEDTITIFLI